VDSPKLLWLQGAHPQQQAQKGGAQPNVNNMPQVPLLKLSWHPPQLLKAPFMVIYGHHL
jgi:hypothetical protein